MRRIRETSRNSAGSTKGHEGDQHNKGHWYKGQNTVSYHISRRSGPEHN